MIYVCCQKWLNCVHNCISNSYNFHLKTVYFCLFLLSITVFFHIWPSREKCYKLGTHKFFKFKRSRGGNVKPKTIIRTKAQIVHHYLIYGDVSSDQPLAVLPSPDIKVNIIYFALDWVNLFFLHLQCLKSLVNLGSQRFCMRVQNHDKMFAE